ncbi:conserved protein of unknown function [Tenacibaculum sp. 190130A14a]|uniref:Uncharacterized protein n=1 Tax=Tenacibaculum polynesiense TaxID=3137857 RepID=A0ABM9PFQ3_9FLAO
MKTYYYKKQLNGRGRFGGTELELVYTTETSEIVDKCKWRDFITEKSSVKETPPILNSYKKYVLEALNFIIQNHHLPKPVKLILHDIKILLVDTNPSHVLASTIIGSLDLLKIKLDKDSMKMIDEFIIINENINFPNFENLILALFRENTESLNHHP